MKTQLTRAETLKVASKLPKKLSAAIMAAVDDLTAVERSKKYKVNMDQWHQPTNVSVYGDELPSDKPAVCQVCFAGALLAKTGEVPPTIAASPWDYDTKLSLALDALDDARQGYVATALRSWPWGSKKRALAKLDALTGGGEEKLIDVVPYSRATRAKFKRQMREIAAKLVELGV